MKPEQNRGMIGLGTALILYAILAAAAIYSLRGVALAIVLLVIGLLAFKSYLHHVRRSMEQ